MIWLIVTCVAAGAVVYGIAFEIERRLWLSQVKREMDKLAEDLRDQGGN